MKEPGQHRNRVLRERGLRPAAKGWARGIIPWCRAKAGWCPAHLLELKPKVVPAEIWEGLEKCPGRAWDGAAGGQAGSPRCSCLAAGTGGFCPSPRGPRCCHQPCAEPEGVRAVPHVPLVGWVGACSSQHQAVPPNPLRARKPPQNVAPKQEHCWPSPPAPTGGKAQILHHGCALSARSTDSALHQPPGSTGCSGLRL